MAKQKSAFNANTFLTTVGDGRTLVSFRKGQTIFTQGEAANSLFVIQTGKVKISVRSRSGKEAVLDILSDTDFVGKDSISGQPSHTASARPSQTAASSELRRKSCYSRWCSK